MQTKTSIQTAKSIHFITSFVSCDYKCTIVSTVLLLELQEHLRRNTRLYSTNITPFIRLL